MTIMIEVMMANDILHQFPAAEKWVIDDSEMLHVVGPEGNLASYASGCWRSVKASNEQSAQ